MSLITAAKASSNFGADVQQEVTLKVAVLANWGDFRTSNRWQPTMNYLSNAIDGYHFEAVPLSFSEMSRQLANGDVQFIVTNPGQFIQISSNHRVSWLATMLSRRHQGQSMAIGTAIWVRKDSDIYSLEQLKNQRLIASGAEALGGYQAAIGLLRRQGMTDVKLFSNVQFSGFPLEQLVDALQTGTADVAFTPFCTMEDMVERGLVDRQEFRLIHDQTPPGYECEVSTDLYPNWSFAASSTVPSAVSKAVTSALLRLEPNDPVSVASGNSGWTSPISQFEVRRLYQSLNLAKDNASSDIKVWMRDNQSYLWIAFVVWLMATLYHFGLQYTFNRRSARLVAYERELKRQEVMLEKLQGAAVVSEVGTGLAHELNQPIAAISNYSSGLTKKLASGEKVENDALLALIAKITHQATRAGEVVHRIRSLLKRKETPAEWILISEIITNVNRFLEQEFRELKVNFKMIESGDEQLLLLDKVGIEQVLINLLKNALDAIREVSGFRQNSVVVKLNHGQQRCKIAIIDSGAGLKMKQDWNIQSFQSTKANGLGVGLAICRDIIAKHGGELRIANRTDEQPGCEVNFSLNSLEEASLETDENETVN
ncbi:sensor histidine kinase [Paraferrimonas haliotis]|uniref:sensor histidine kinase n=1 Tax=Paraferrimonas haliotis TaxID=2013866 RepID=UPI0015CDFDAC|nr:sensor histidine kinase [Paraferrimonas haliotis]